MRTYAATEDSDLLRKAASELCESSNRLLYAEDFWESLSEATAEIHGWDLIEELHASRGEFLTWELELPTSGEHAHPIPLPDAFELLSGLGDAIEQLWIAHQTGIDGLALLTDIEAVRALFAEATKGVCSFESADDEPSALARAYRFISRQRWRLGGFGTTALNGLAIASIIVNPAGIFGAGSVLSGLLIAAQGPHDPD